MRRTDQEVWNDIHKLLEGRGYRATSVSQVMRLLDSVMGDEKAGPEFVRLLQKWLAVR